MEMGDQYGFADLRQLIAGRSCFPPAALPQQPVEQQHFIGGHHRNNLTTGRQQQQQQQQQHYEMLILGGPLLQVGGAGSGGGGDHHHHQVVLPRGAMMDFCSAADSTTNTHNNNNVTSTTAATNATSASSAGGVCGFLEIEAGCNINGGGGGDAGGGDNGGNSRWPRQETLTLLEIRSSLDPKFKDANQKGPLWDEVSRIMAEEHGYQRSGKKCREKFENLYKYYKKTKEGKAGRQDGKNYRFFRQLEALYGDATSNNPTSISHTQFDGNINLGSQTTTNTSTQSHQELRWQPHDHKLSESLSPSNASEFANSSSEDDSDDINTISFLEDSSLMEKKNKKLKDNRSLKRGRKSWKAKIKDFIDSRTKKWMETQEAWLDKMLKTLEHKEEERIVREEEWKRQETARIDQEHKFWAKERAWLVARDAALMEALQRFVGTDIKTSSPDELMATEYHENSENLNENATQAIKKIDVNSHDRWTEAEISSLIHLRTGMEARLQQSGCSEKGIWEEISAKMCCLGYIRSAQNCEEKWVDINKYFRRTSEFSKKRKENSSSTSPYFQQIGPIYRHEGAFLEHGGVNEEGPEIVGIQLNDGPSPSNSNAGTSTVQESCFRYMMTEGDNNMWENYCVKFNKGGNQQN